MALFGKKKKVKIGLALGGGGARGFAHIGAIKAFEENGIKFDKVAGTSVGSLIGAFYAAGYTYEQMYEVAKKVDIKDIKSNKILFIPSKTDGIENLIKNELGDINIEQLPKPFWAVAVDMISTQEMHINKGNLAKAVAGSCAVPGVFHPVEFEGKLLSDGGLSNTLPSNVLKLNDCDYVVAIDINPARSRGTESTKVMDILACSIRILMKSNVLKGYLYADVLLKPDTKRFRSTKKEGFEEMIEEGYKAAMENMDKIKALFKTKPLGKRKRKKLVAEINKH
jgi:NTE family protein